MPSSFSSTSNPIFFNSFDNIAILSVSLYRACFTLKISIGFSHFNASIATAGSKSGVSDKSNFPPFNETGDSVVMISSSNLTFTPNLSKISTIASSPWGISPKFISIVSPSPNNTFAANNKARLEKSEGIENLNEILREVDAEMVARGDLGVEIPMERVPIVQKEIVKKASMAAKNSSIATQILRTMVTSPTPTRAEVSDITNAVLDGCDSILLSDEIAVGQYPVEAVVVADVTIKEAEKIYVYNQEFSWADRTQAKAAIASELVGEINSKPIVITSTGRAAFELARFRPNADIIVFSHDESVLRKLALAWGVCPVGVLPANPAIAELVQSVVTAGIESGMISTTDVVTIVHGFLTGVGGTTNTIQVLDLQEYLEYER